MTSDVSLMKVGSLVTRGKNIPSRYWPMSSVGQLIVDTMGLSGISTVWEYGDVCDFRRHYNRDLV